MRKMSLQEDVLPRIDRATRYVTASRDMSVKILSTVETSCTTNPQHIEVMELEGYSRPTCSKQLRLDRGLSYRCRQQARPSTSTTTTTSFVNNAIHPLAVTKFLKSGV